MSTENLLIPPANEFVINRVVDAPRNLVYAAWTECEHLSKWWGPKDFKLVVCDNELKPGGTFHYCLQFPDNGPQMWGKWVYREIVALEKLVFIASFSDAAKGITVHPMDSKWPLETLSVVEFSDDGTKTTVTLRGWPINASDEQEQAFLDGHGSMTQGWGGTFGQLEAYLAEIQA